MSWQYPSMYSCDYPPEWDDEGCEGCEDCEDEDCEGCEELTDEEIDDQKTHFLVEQERAEQRRIEQESHEYPWKGGR
jgi:hypothetical protein